MLGRVKNNLPTGSSLHLGGCHCAIICMDSRIWHLKCNIFVLFSTFSHYPNNNLLCAVKNSLRRGITLQLGGGRLPLRNNMRHLIGCSAATQKYSFSIRPKFGETCSMQCI